MPLPTRTKIAIVGSGPAGYTAAIYAGRANLEPVLFEGGGAAIEPITVPGGQLMITTEVENYPGFPKGVQGPELMELFKAQAERFGTQIVTADVTAVDISDRPFRVTSTDGELMAETLIVATGASAKWLGIPSEQKFQNYGVSACATCDGVLFKGRDLVVVGGGDTAMEEATFLTRFATKVYARAPARRVPRLANHDRPGAPQPEDRVRHQRARSTRSSASCRGPGVTGVRLRDTRDGTTRDLPAGGVFVAIGHEPNSRLFQGLLDMDEAGYLKTQPGSTATRFRACSPAGTWPITFTARPSPPPGPAAWPPSTRNVSSDTTSRADGRASMRPVRAGRPHSWHNPPMAKEPPGERQATTTTSIWSRPRARSRKSVVVEISEPLAVPARSTIPPTRPSSCCPRSACSQRCSPPICVASPPSASRRSTRRRDDLQGGDEGRQDVPHPFGRGAHQPHRPGHGRGGAGGAARRTHFGEMALIDDFPRSADARAHEACRLFVIRKEDMEDLLFVDRDLAYDLLWSFVRTLSSPAARNQRQDDLHGGHFEVLSNWKTRQEP